ncbi:hypothetical protein DXG01_014185 [Tephrocybe rancida]|nr:hypothetical protein DXG01_014185 [Tephrocybe rancida]
MQWGRDVPCEGGIIEPGELRIGRSLCKPPHQRLYWRHWRCITYRMLELLKDSDPSEITGFHDLKPEDQKLVESAWSADYVTFDALTIPKKAKGNSAITKSRGEEDSSDDGGGEDDESSTSTHQRVPYTMKSLLSPPRRRKGNNKQSLKAFNDGDDTNDSDDHTQSSKASINEGLSEDEVVQEIVATTSGSEDGNSNGNGAYVDSEEERDWKRVCAFHLRYPDPLPVDLKWNASHWEQFQASTTVPLDRKWSWRKDNPDQASPQMAVFPLIIPGGTPDGVELSASQNMGTNLSKVQLPPQAASPDHANANGSTINDGERKAISTDKPTPPKKRKASPGPEPEKPRKIQTARKSVYLSDNARDKKRLELMRSERRRREKEKRSAKKETSAGPPESSTAAGPSKKLLPTIKKHKTLDLPKVASGQKSDATPERTTNPPVVVKRPYVPKRVYE